MMTSTSMAATMANIQRMMRPAKANRVLLAGLPMLIALQTAWTTLMPMLKMSLGETAGDRTAHVWAVNAQPEEETEGDDLGKGDSKNVNRVHTRDDLVTNSQSELDQGQTGEKFLSRGHQARLKSPYSLKRLEDAIDRTGTYRSLGLR